MSLSQEPAPHSSSTPERARMVGWYDPLQLIRTAMQVAVSTLFGRNAAYRLIEALAQPTHTETVVTPDVNGDVWIDYVADLGDGWNSTYAIAQSVAQDGLEVTDPVTG